MPPPKSSQAEGSKVSPRQSGPQIVGDQCISFSPFWRKIIQYGKVHIWPQNWGNIVNLRVPSNYKSLAKKVVCSGTWNRLDDFKSAYFLCNDYQKSDPKVRKEVLRSQNILHSIKPRTKTKKKKTVPPLSRYSRARNLLRILPSL